MISTLIKRIFFVFIFVGLLPAIIHAQSEDGPLQKININDTLLRTNRTLLVAEPFNAQKVLLQLFPGKYYRLSKETFINELINWTCNTAKLQKYIDVNEDAVPVFPFENGVATRLLNVLDYKDAAGIEYKVMSFNHSEYDEDGAMTSRFTGGLLGLAKFIKTPSGWKLRIFQPAIAAYGAFSHCPAPQLLLIGKDQYAFMIKHSNGGGGGPFDGAYFLIGGANGAYQQMMAAYGIERTASENGCSWTSTYQVPESTKTYFRDILVTIKGKFKNGEAMAVPDSIAEKIKGFKKGTFTIEQRYVYKNGKGYELQSPVKTKVEK